MGTIYNIPNVGTLTFTSTGYVVVPFSNINPSQLNALTIMRNSGIRYVVDEWIASDSSNNYVGFYKSGNSYYVGYNNHGGKNYTAYYGYKAHVESYSLNLSDVEQGVYISDYPHPLTDAPPNVDFYNSLSELRTALSDIILYPITYSYTNSTVSGPSQAAIGDTVIVSAVPNVDYGITDASSQIIVTNNDVAVPYTWDAANNTITFTMPDPT